MEDFVEIHWTTASLDEARKVSRYLAVERLVASAQIVPWLETIYMWNNQLETTQESLVILKTVKANIERIKQVITENTSYQVPQILEYPITGGNKAFLDWMKESMPEGFVREKVEK